MAGERQVHTHATLSKVADLKRTELIIQEVAQNAGKAVQDFKQTDLLPDPSFTLQLSDETLSGSNLLAFQKFFDGKFQFDLFYESRSAQKALSGICLLNHRQRLQVLTLPQPLPSMMELPHFPPHSASASTRYSLFLIPQDGKRSKHFRKQSPRTCSVGLDISTAHRS